MNKAHRLFLVFLTTVMLLGLPLKADATSWEYLGPSGFTANNSHYLDLALDGSDTPYLGYRSGNASKTSVMKYNSLSSSWEQVGAQDFSPGYADYISLALDSSNVPYVAFRDSTVAFKAVVMKYNGSAWVNVGSAGFTANQAEYGSLALDSSDTPFLAFCDHAQSYKATVMKFNGTTWETVGSAGFSFGHAFGTSLALDSSDTPYVAYQDYDNASKATVMKYNGTIWENVGSAAFSAGAIRDIHLVLDGSDTPYLAFRDVDNGSKATVMKFNGTSWELVGTAGFSAGSTEYLSLTLNSSGVPYVGYQDEANDSHATVMKFNGSSWEPVGVVGFSDGETREVCLALDSSDTPILVYSNYTDSGKSRMMTYTGTPNTPEMDVQGKGISIVNGDTSPASADDTDFGTPYVGNTIEHTFTIQNLGDADLTLSGTPLVDITGSNAGDFSITAAPASPVASSGGKTTFTVEFAPSAANLRRATISISNNDSNENPYTFDIEGVGLSAAPEMDVQGKGVSIPDGSTSPSTADDTDFGHTFIGNTAEHIFTIQNVGSLDLNLDGNPKVEITGTHAGDFTITSEPSSPVTPGGGTTTFTVEFAPGGENLRTATVSISSNDFDEDPYDFVIAGTGHTLPVEIVYWTDHDYPGTIFGADKRNGSGKAPYITGLESPHDIAVDAGGGKFYFTDPDTGTISRSNLDGTGLETVLDSLGDGIRGIAVDHSGSRFYFTDHDNNAVYRANLDGTGFEQIISGLDRPHDLALDVAAGKVYFTDPGTGEIRRSNLDGTGLETLLAGLGDGIRGIAVDPSGGKFYWIDHDLYVVNRANLDGSGLEEIISGLDKPHDVVLDADNGKLYFTDPDDEMIYRSSLDGSGLEVLINSIGSDIRGIALMSSSDIFSDDFESGDTDNWEVPGS